MAVQYRNVGPDRRDEVAPQRARHDLRRSGVKVAEALRTPMGGLGTMLVLAVFSVMVPAAADLLWLIGFFMFLFIRGAQRKYTLPARMPKQSNVIDPMEVIPGTNKATSAKGTFYLGNDRTTGEEVWLNNRDAGVHMLVLGTTGSGKTEMLLGLCQNALNQGSGFMFVDGKAQDKIAFKIQDLCWARGRSDDVLILNFMTGARDIIGAQANKITNTMNPFSYGSSGMISQIVVGLMSSGAGGDDMWKDRAISFVEALSPPLVYLRDNYGLILDVNEYRKYFELDRLEELCWNGKEKYPGLEQVLDPMTNYLRNLPAYDEKKFGKGKKGQGDDTKLQHGFITMQLVRAFTSLADTYGHIVRVPLGEVYFPDLVKQRRILIAMLPSLEKTPAETANIGKIIVTALRNIMAEGLGSTLEGSRDELDNDDGRSLLSPYVVILDEYGYYAVKGFAVAFAQARSLGFVCVVGGQDLASFQRESKEEAVSICGNTRIKAFGSIEDPEQTMDFVVKTAGKGLVAETGGYEGDMGMASMKYADTLNIHLKAVERIDPSDIKEQIEGQFTFVWRSRVIRATTYYVNPKKVKRVQLNHFLQVPPPSAAQVQAIEAMSASLINSLSTEDFRMFSIPPVRDIEVAAQSHVALAGEGKTGVLVEAFAPIMALKRHREEQVQGYVQNLRARPEVARVPDMHPDDREDDFNPMSFLAETGVAPLAETPNGEEPVARSGAPMRRDSPAVDFNSEASNFAPDGFASRGSPADGGDTEEDVDITPFAQMNVALPEKTGFAQNIFGGATEVSQDVQKAIGEGLSPEPLLNLDSTYQGLNSIERAMGATEDEADASAKEVVKSIGDATRYPQAQPTEKSIEQIGSLFNELFKLLDGHE